MATTTTNHCQSIILALIFIMGILASQYSSRPLDEQTMVLRHNAWIALHGRLYKDAEEKETRFNIFKKNVEYIEAFNADVDRGYKLSVNKFADLTNEEFRAFRNGYKRQSSEVLSSSKPSFRYANTSGLPSTMDWRKTGAVTPVKDQGQCGSCWAFSAVAAMEGITKLKTGKLISLSEQELIDCDIRGQDEGCLGGFMEDAFKFIKQNKGLTTEANYPYIGKDGTCNTTKASIRAANITGYEEVPSNSEKSLSKAVANQPVSVAIDAGGFSFQFYSSGVFSGPCGTDLNHGVTAVGFGSTSNGTNYWLLKNSWGAEWGENGYIRMKKDVNASEGLCGIAMDASYPIA